VIGSPLVSVIVPAWNAQTTLPETLASIQSQTYENLEIIIVDDGSTDLTSEIAEAFCRKESRASLLRKANGGLSSARNAAIAPSRGEWIAPLDADDIWHPTAVAKLVSAAVSARQRPGLVYCWYRDMDETGHLLGSGPRWAFSGPALQRLAYWNTIHSVLLSRQAVEEVGGYDEDLRACEDIMMQLSIARRHPVAVVPEHLLGYRTRPGSMSTNSEVVVQSWRNVNRKLVADGARIPQQVLRWNEGFFERIFAEQSLRLGDLRGTVSHMFRAVRIDPLRWGSYAAYRLTRSVRHRIFGRRKPLPPLVFGKVDPRAALPSDADQIGWFAAILRQIDAARLRRLQASERLEG
jgi:glycosyltransferase involved in cell wall biosynthesis